MNTATFGVPATDAGVASATVNTSQQIGGSLGTALLNTIATTATASYLVGKQATSGLVAQPPSTATPRRSPGRRSSSPSAASRVAFCCAPAEAGNRASPLNPLLLCKSR
jgi:hypothetical protein